ncbi:epoxide hydrolase 4 [Marchantia polymorpha subsp. ruderalis]
MAAAAASTMVTMSNVAGRKTLCPSARESKTVDLHPRATMPPSLIQVRQMSKTVSINSGKTKGSFSKRMFQISTHQGERSSVRKIRCVSGQSTPRARGPPAIPAKVEMHEEEIVDGVNVQHGYLNNKDVKIHFVECGDPAGKLVILVHGWPNFWYVWKHQFKALAAAGYHVIALDLRGYNLSSKPEKLESFVRSEVLSDFVCFIDIFGNGEPAIMVGHDWGSTISWCFAEDYPSKVERLVTINMGRLTDFSQILRSNPAQLLRSWYIGAFQIPHLAEHAIAYDRCLILREICRNCIPSMSTSDIERHVTAYSIPGAIKGSLTFYRAAVRGLWHLPDKKVPVVKTPVTVFWGDKDSFLLPIVAEPSKDTALNAKVVHLPQCAHWPMWDDPKLFNELLLETIAGKSS